MKLARNISTIFVVLVLSEYLCELVAAGSNDSGDGHGSNDEHSQGSDKSGKNAGKDSGSRRSNRGGPSRGSRDSRGSEISSRHGSSRGHHGNRYISDEYKHRRRGGHRHGDRHQGYGTPTCADQSEHCELRQNLCIAEWAFEEMARDCARTCNRCHGDLLDISEHCRPHAHECQQEAERDLMAWQCPYTCGYTHSSRPRPRGRTAPLAPNAVANNNCVDKNECTFWGQAFCQNTYYNVETKRASCPRMCGLCSSTTDYLTRMPY